MMMVLVGQRQVIRTAVSEDRREKRFSGLPQRLTRRSE